MIYKVMDKAYDAIAEIERLKAELRSKTDSFENLKQFQNAKGNQIREAKHKNEKLEQELIQKEDGIIEIKQKCEDLEGNLIKKESIIKHLSAANDKLRGDFDEKLKKWEDEKKGLVLALEEAVEKAENRDQQIHEYKQEIESLKGCLSASKRSLAVEKKSEASEELRKNDDILQNLQDENRKVAEQLKWKKEQFTYLEEAHEKIKEQFKFSKKEWELEKTSLLDEMSSLQMKLDSQIRISENLQSQLQMCSQALAHEESKRKRLEVQVAEYKERVENVSCDYENARIELEQFDSQRDKDVGDMRYSLKAKEAHCKELKYTIQKLEQDNKELMASLKELQEAQIQEAGASYSQSKLRSKLKNLENIHRECASTLQAKEAEWKLQCLELMKQLDMKNATLIEAQKYSKEELYSLQDELDRHKEMLEESTECQLLFKEKTSQMESDSREKLEEVSDALDRANTELDVKIYQVNELEYELQIWMSIVEKLKNDLEENHVIRQELENALLEQVGFSESLKQDKDSLILKLQENEIKLDDLGQQVILLEQKLERRQSLASSPVRPPFKELNH